MSLCGSIASNSQLRWSVCVCVTGWFHTWTPAQVFDINLLLLHARRLPDQTGIVVGIAVSGTNRVLVVATAVDVTYTPAGGEMEQLAGG